MPNAGQIERMLDQREKRLDRTKRWRRYPARSGIRARPPAHKVEPTATLVVRSGEYDETTVRLSLANPCSRTVAFWSNVIEGGGVRVLDARASFSATYSAPSGASSVEVRDGGPDGPLLARAEVSP